MSASKGETRWVGEMGVHEPLGRLHACETCGVCGETIVIVDVSVEPRNRSRLAVLLGEMQARFGRLHECEEEVPVAEIEDRPLRLSKEQMPTDEQQESPDDEDTIGHCPVENCGVLVSSLGRYAPYCSKEHREAHS